MNNIGFSIDMHDSDGDVVSDGIIIHINDFLLLKMADSKELGVFIENLQKIKTEIEECYGR